MRLSILIPAMNEPYLEHTVRDIAKHSDAETEILIGFDSFTEEDDFDVTDLEIPVRAITSETNIGQRAMTNRLAEIAEGEYVMKVDAHCSFQQGFDWKMLQDMDNKTILAPYLLGLDAENWQIKQSPQSSQYVFDTNLVMQYAPDMERPDPVTETMCLQGSAWMVSRRNYFDWNLGDESLGSWGGQGVELGIKAYLNGGVCKTTKKAYYGHLFRHTEEEFPYERSQKEIEKTQKTVLARFKNESIVGLVERYNYPADWTKKAIKDLL